MMKTKRVSSNRLTHDEVLVRVAAMHGGKITVTGQYAKQTVPLAVRARHEISVSNISCIWTNCIVPFSVERVGTNIYFFNLFF